MLTALVKFKSDALAILNYNTSHALLSLVFKNLNVFLFCPSNPDILLKKFAEIFKCKYQRVPHFWGYIRFHLWNLLHGQVKTYSLVWLSTSLIITFAIAILVIIFTTQLPQLISFPYFMIFIRLHAICFFVVKLFNFLHKLV